MALYELPLDLLESAEYLDLLKNRSERERTILARLALLGRRVYKLSATLGGMAIGELLPYLISVESDQALERKKNDWHPKEQATLLHELPGWRRSRRYELKEGRAMHTLALHKFASRSALGTPAFRTISSPGHDEDAEAQRPNQLRSHELYHTFSAADFERPAKVGESKS